MKLPEYLTLPAAILFVVGVHALSPRTGTSEEPQLEHADRVVVENAWRLRAALGDQLWPGWSEISIPLVYVAGDHEFAIGFDSAPDGFSSSEQTLADMPVYVRKRELSPNLAAAFPFQGTPCVVIGTPKALESGPTRWTLTAVHEMFHVLQMSRGSMQKVDSLKIVEGDNDGSWQLNYPFPYDHPDVMRLFHLTGYPLYLAVEKSQTDIDVKYNIGTTIDAMNVLQGHLQNETGDDRAYDYARFQLWYEGIARYTEHQMARLAAESGFEPTEDMQSLPDYKPYHVVWERDYEPQANLFKHAGRVARSRTEFYHLGLGMGLALDRSGIDWKEKYFASDVWLDDLLKQAAEPATGN
jgi:hypothetical protein